jgi:DNA invertase Pin-like site-specific DNA recombinase
MNGKRVGLYLRVSTGEQTIETQRMGLVAACEARGWRGSKRSSLGKEMVAYATTKACG